MNRNSITIALGVLLVLVVGGSSWGFIYLKNQLTKTQKELENAKSEITKLEQDLKKSLQEVNQKNDEANRLKNSLAGREKEIAIVGQCLEGMVRMMDVILSASDSDDIESLLYKVSAIGDLETLESKCNQAAEIIGELEQ